MDLGNLYTDVNTIVMNMTGQVVSIYDFGLVRKFNLEIEGTNGLYFIEIHTKESKKAIFKVIKD